MESVLDFIMYIGKYILGFIATIIISGILYSLYETLDKLFTKTAKNIILIVVILGIIFFVYYRMQ